ncbi:I78 family peptidase inhibitor [Variovorax atrisoli]|uniref:I78 family peptidase inhibitor n=1 Tax=Variovorax atrisoli TaxID=3394203 RepID=UPI00403FE8C4
MRKRFACGIPPAKDEAPAGACRSDGASALTGSNGVSGAEAQQLAGASMVLHFQPGQPVTMDYRRERATIETDPKTGKIVLAYRA